MIVPDGEDDKVYISKGYKIINVPVDFKADFIDDIEYRVINGVYR